MDWERFLDIMLTLQKEDKVIQKAYDIGVDMINFVDPYHQIISTLFLEIWGEEGHGWWSWYCYDNNFGQGGLTANDKDGNPICYSLETLYEEMENCRKERNINK
jgi:hypothetical protein